MDNLEKYERTSEGCWKDCRKKGGKCSLCGESGYCCRNEYHPTWNGDCPIRAIQAARKNGHDCVSPKHAQVAGKNKFKELVGFMIHLFHKYNSKNCFFLF